MVRMQTDVDRGIAAEATASVGTLTDPAVVVVQTRVWHAIATRTRGVVATTHIAGIQVGRTVAGQIRWLVSTEALARAVLVPVEFYTRCSSCANVAVINRSRAVAGASAVLSRIQQPSGFAQDTNSAGIDDSCSIACTLTIHRRIWLSECIRLWFSFKRIFGKRIALPSLTSIPVEPLLHIPH